MPRRTRVLLLYYLSSRSHTCTIERESSLERGPIVLGVLGWPTQGRVSECLTFVVEAPSSLSCNKSSPSSRERPDPESDHHPAPFRDGGLTISLGSVSQSRHACLALLAPMLGLLGSLDCNSSCARANSHAVLAHC